MKKKLIAIAIASVVAAPLTAQAAAKISGDAEFIMSNHKASGWSGTNRVRVKVDADLGEGVSVHTRFRTTTGWDNSGAEMGVAPALTVDTDYSHLNVKVGPAMLVMGDQLGTWGTKYFIEGVRKDNRLKAVFKPMKSLKAAIMLDPIADEEGKGAPAFTFNAAYKMGNMMTVGLMHGLEQTHYDGTASGRTVDAWTDVFLTGSMGGVNFGVEIKDNVGSSTDADGSGRYIMVGTKVAGMTIELHNSDHAKGQDGDWSPLGVINGDANQAGGMPSTTLVTVATEVAGFGLKAGAGTAGPDGATESVMGVDLGKKFGPADFNLSVGSYDGETAFGFSFMTDF